MFLAHTLPHFQRVRGLLEWTASSGRVSPETAVPQVTSVSPGLGAPVLGLPLYLPQLPVLAPDLHTLGTEFKRKFKILGLY